MIMASRKGGTGVGKRGGHHHHSSLVPEVLYRRKKQKGEKKSFRARYLLANSDRVPSGRCLIQRMWEGGGENRSKPSRKVPESRSINRKKNGALPAVQDGGKEKVKKTYPRVRFTARPWSKEETSRSKALKFNFRARKKRRKEKKKKTNKLRRAQERAWPEGETLRDKPGSLCNRKREVKANKELTENFK